MKCITFNKEAQDNLPQEIKDKMKADRDKAKREMKKSKYRVCPYCGCFIPMSYSFSDHKKMCKNVDPFMRPSYE